MVDNLSSSRQMTRNEQDNSTAHSGPLCGEEFLRKYTPWLLKH